MIIENTAVVTHEFLTPNDSELILREFQLAFEAGRRPNYNQQTLTQKACWKILMFSHHQNLFSAEEHKNKSKCP